MKEKQHTVADPSSRTVLITGASRGIGKAIALRLAQDGFLPVIHYHKNADAAERVAQSVEHLGQTPRLLSFNIADREQTRKALEKDIGTNGVYYGIVCNAGIVSDNAFPAMTAQEWDDVLRTNLDGFFNVLHPLVMLMVRARRPGRIVTISSVSGLVGNRGQVNYSAAKAGIIGATKALALELAKRDITVNCIAPGLIDTDMLPKYITEQIISQIPARRAGTPEEVAAAVAFLMRDDAAYITRQVISVNGGLL